MRIAIIYILFFYLSNIYACVLCAQDTERGLIAIDIQKKKGTKRALVVGISNYYAKSLKLNYADDDALIFSKYLREVEHIPEKNVTTLITNDSMPVPKHLEPTSNNILNALTDLMNETQEGDVVYFYFAGHGDVVPNEENKDEGFLLAIDVNEDRNYFGTSGVIALKHLDSVITAITNKGAKFILTLDACRSGFLYKEGTQKSLETFNNNFQHSTKFFSCKPNELSLESKVIGHGYFTYYLVLGLLGAADGLVPDNNLQYFELSTFLANYVNQETNKKQSPIVWTQYFNENFAPVNPEFKEIALQTLSNSSGIKDIFKSRSTTDYFSENFGELPLVIQFNQALQDKNYFDTETSAMELLKKTKNDTTINALVAKKMEYSLVNSLSLEAQILINQYISNAQNLPSSSEYNQKAGFLKKALEMLDPKAFNYDRLYMSQLFLEAYAIIRATNYSRYPEAKKKLYEALKIEERAAYIHNALGIVLNHENNYKEAEFHYKRAQELIPTWSFPTNNLGVSYFDQYQYGKAESYFNLALLYNETNATSMNNLGAVSERKGRYKEAEQFYLSAKESDSSYAVVTLRNLGHLYNKSGNIQKASDYFKQAYEKDTLNVHTLYAYAHFLNEHHLDVKSAENLLKKAIELEPYFSKGFAEYADWIRMYAYNNDAYAKAHELYDFAIQNDPHYEWSYAGKGWLFHKQNKKDEAELVFKRSIDTNPNKPKAYYYLANYYKGGLMQPLQAETYYLKAIEKDSFYMPAYESLIELYNQNNRHEESILFINQLLKHNTNAPTLYTLLGDTYFDLGNFVEATKAYQQSILTDKTYAKGYANFSYCLLMNGDYEEAVKNYKIANEQNSNKNSLAAFAKFMLSEARKQNRANEKEKELDLLLLANDLVKSEETSYALGRFYYMNNKAEKAQHVIAEMVQHATSKSWQLKLLDLATKIEIDLHNGAKASLFLDSLNKINPQPSKTLQALVYAVNGKTKLAKEELSKENEVLLNESFLKQGFSPNAIQLIQKIKK